MHASDSLANIIWIHDAEALSTCPSAYHDNKYYGTYDG